MLRRLISQNIINKGAITAPLGRWCHPHYNDSCTLDVQMKKGSMADNDNNTFYIMPDNDVVINGTYSKDLAEKTLIEFVDPNMTY